MRIDRFRTCFIHNSAKSNTCVDFLWGFEILVLFFSIYGQSYFDRGEIVFVWRGEYETVGFHLISIL